MTENSFRNAISVAWYVRYFVQVEKTLPEDSCVTVLYHLRDKVGLTSFLLRREIQGALQLRYVVVHNCLSCDRTRMLEKGGVNEE